MKSIWILGFFLNLFFLYAVFQIYFQSPVVSINDVFRSDFQPPKFSRVVFIVCDGLRADTFFNYPLNHPYLTNLLHQSNSVFGISDTRVPTESRPGHIALFAGIYEDPSAIFTGWKKNLVEFDSVFNRSKYSIALGSPDIVDMFADGAGKENIYSESYPASWQDFLQANSSVLDTWVLDRLQSIIRRNGLPTHDGILIFLHMLGVDNTGHATKPNSKEYLASVGTVNEIVPRIEKLVSEYYRHDDKTLFVFTSDHGMTDWGSHGAGSIEETETPFIIWGAGIKSKDFQLRFQQADFSALISGVLSTDFPTNSIGRFPSGIWDDLQFEQSSTLANCRQIRRLMIGKRGIVNRGVLPFVPYANERILENIVMEVDAMSGNDSHTNQISRLHKGIDLALEGIAYYERYDQFLMQCFVMSSFLIWMAVIASSIICPRKLKLVTISDIAILLTSYIVTRTFLEWSTWRLPYTVVPLYLCRLLASQVTFLRRTGTVSPSLKTLIAVSLVGILGIEILVKTFYRREMISIWLGMNSAWTLVSKNSISTSDKVSWILLTILVSIFPNIPIIQHAQNPFAITSCSIVTVIVSLWWMQKYSIRMTLLRAENYQTSVVYFQILLLASSSVFIHFPELFLTRILAWFSVISFIGIPVFLSSQILSLQFLSIFLGIGTPFFFLSLNYEVFFLPSLFSLLFVFLKLEIGTKLSWKEFWLHPIDPPNRAKEFNINLMDSFRIACFYLCLVYLSFFGIGNIASISSFDPTASRCFVSIFSPFIMMGLLLIKIVGPFLLVASTIRFRIWSWKEIEDHFVIVLFLCQGMALHMFLNVTNMGSWLEIGTSISHYVIVQVTTLFLFLLFVIANYLTGIVKFPVLEFKGKFL